MFPEIEIVDVISTHMLEDYNVLEEQIDLIITTIHAENSLQIPEVVVSALFTERDQENVRNVIRGLA